MKMIIKKIKSDIHSIFLSENRKLARMNHFPYSDLKKRISLNLVNNISHKNKKVIYTCITGGYDELIIPSFYNQYWDYICFTDNEKLLDEKQYGPWTVKPLVYTDETNAINNRWHKFHAHKLFPEYEESIYIDGNLDILDNFLFEEIEEKKDKTMLIPVHYCSDCIYKEIKRIKRAKKATEVQLIAIKKYLKNKKFPKHYGLTENNIIYRKHNDRQIIEIMDEWWSLLQIVPRDQLSLSYILWEKGIKISDIVISNARVNLEHYHFYYSEKHN